MVRSTSYRFDGDDQIVLDPAGNAYVAISSQLTGNYDVAVLKYRPDGALAWVQRLARGSDDLLWDRHTAWSGQSTVYAGGHLYVSGQTRHPETLTNFLLFKMPTT